MDAEELNQLTARLDRILEGVGQYAEPEMARSVAELVDGLQRVHAEGLRRLVQLVAEEPELLDRALDDPVISNLFFLYDLAVVDAEDRVEEALESARVMARSHGGELELLEVQEGRVKLRVRWSHDSVSREADTLREGIEWALRERLPGFRALEVEGLDEEIPAGDEPGAVAADSDDRGLPIGEGPVGPDGELAGRGSDEATGGSDGGGGGRELPVMGQRSVVPNEKMSRLEERLEEAKQKSAASGARAEREPRRVNLCPEGEVPDEGLMGELVEGYPVLALATGDGPRAYRNTCPGSMLPLHFGDREDGAVVCPWHGCRFDAATGHRLDEEGSGLQRLESGVDGGHLWVEVPAREQTDARAGPTGETV